MRLKWLLTLSMATVGAWASPLQAELCEAYFNLDAGYRRDSLSTVINSTTLNDEITTQNQLKVKDLTLFQLGCKGQLLLCDAFVRGEAYWGWAGNGIYHKATRISSNYTKLNTKTHLHNGRTKDFTLLAGYYFSLCGLLDLAPVGGWSYQSQEFKIKKVQINNFSRDSLQGAQYSNYWQGPCVGVDARLDLCGFRMRGGYTYHWATWHAKWILKDQYEMSFSESGKSSSAHGQVVHLNVLMPIFPCVEAGVGFKWQKWRAQSGKGKIVLPVAGHQKKNSKVKHSCWDSYVVSLDLGIIF
ncbi:MAG: hypothetical protein H0T62_07275 [Parachlamydiaceae bacterium]|nr:hypothetical protein [Parachlamydiaceae bacterium]